MSKKFGGPTEINPTKLAFGVLGGLALVTALNIYSRLIDSWKEPYLHNPVQSLGADCGHYVFEGSYLPERCAQRQYEIIAPYYLHEYGLHSFSRSRIGWFRVGTDAVLLGPCSESCEIYEIKRHVFI